MTVVRTDVQAVQSEVQGNVLLAYLLPCVRHLVVRVRAAPQARAALGAMLDPTRPGPTITSGAPRPREDPGPFVNVGITYDGLQALGVPEASLLSFPPEFRQGMVARAARLGDVGTSGTDVWVESLRRSDAVHLIFTVHGRTKETTAQVAAEIIDTGQGAFTGVGQFEGAVLSREVVARAEDGTEHRQEVRVEHFGFRDGISQPRFEGIRRAPDPSTPDSDPGTRPKDYEPLGVVLLGHPSGSAVGVPVPSPHALGYQGSFNAVRILAQDVARFRAFVAGTARLLGIDEELFKAKLCGRWPNGVPLAVATTTEQAERVFASNPDLNGLNDFDFSDDQDGATCPVGSHIRRTNPRAAQIVQRPANRTRRLVRRGMPFGPLLGEGEEQRDPRQRGLLGSFLCASLSSQFEAMHYDWINLGLQDPSITSTNDPLVGANEVGSSSFTLTTRDGRQRTIQGLPRFVETMGGAYCFLPSMRAIHWIAGARWAADDPTVN